MPRFIWVDSEDSENSKTRFFLKNFVFQIVEFFKLIMNENFYFKLSVNLLIQTFLNQKMRKKISFSFQNSKKIILKTNEHLILNYKKNFFFH